MKEINLRPRKYFGWKTPYEVYHFVKLYLTWQFKLLKNRGNEKMGNIKRLNQVKDEIENLLEEKGKCELELE